MKRLVLLGATGSIGVQTVDVVLQHPDQFEIIALSAGRNIAKLQEILADIHPKQVCVMKESDAVDCRKHIRILILSPGMKDLHSLQSAMIMTFWSMPWSGLSDSCRR